MEETQTTQKFRDVLQQSDHDAIVELRVMSQTVINDLHSMRNDVKGNQLLYAQTLTAYQSKVEEINKNTDFRLRKLEDALIVGAPWGTD